MKYMNQVMNIPLFFFRTYSREIIDMFPYMDKNFIVGSHRHCSGVVFKTLHNYNLAWGLPICTRFGDLDLVSKSQVCQNHKLQIVFFSFLYTIV